MPHRVFYTMVRLTSYGINNNLDNDSGLVGQVKANTEGVFDMKKWFRPVRVVKKYIDIVVNILDEPAKPFEHLKWANGRTLDLATYMKEHPYMYASDNVRAVFRVAKAMVSDVIDLFGTEVTFSDEDDAGVTVTAFTNEMAMEQFALNFAPDVTVLEPQRLREKVKSALEKALEKYE